MSHTFSLVCKEAKLKIWVGQGKGGALISFYSKQPETMEHLRRFLQVTQGKPLVLLCDDTDWWQFEDCEEFEDSQQATARSVADRFMFPETKYGAL